MAPEIWRSSNFLLLSWSRGHFFCSWTALLQNKYAKHRRKPDQVMLMFNPFQLYEISTQAPEWRTLPECCWRTTGLSLFLLCCLLLADPGRGKTKEITFLDSRFFTLLNKAQNSLIFMKKNFTSERPFHFSRMLKPGLSWALFLLCHWCAGQVGH